jgi:hypothetical protein
MKKFFLSFFVLCSFVLVVDAQNVQVSGAVAGNGLYPDLGSAFTAINAGSQTSATITVSILDNTIEPVSAVLNAGTWTSLTISPAGAAPRTIVGFIIGQLIDLNGADNVTIDGLNTGGNSLTIRNIATGFANTIRFINDATNNNITNCTLQGSASSLQYAVVNFGTGTITGNDNNTISNCDIGAANSTPPINGIFSLGTSAGVDNSGINISNNNISDFFNDTQASVGLNINNTNASSSSAWTISNNKFFQTGTRIYTAGNTHQAIYIGGGDGFTISGNTIGYAAANNTGVYTMAGAVATKFIAIDLAVGTTTATSVQGNTITAISLSTSSNTATGNGVLCGINIMAGNVNIGTVNGNKIGSSTGTDAIVATPTATQAAVVGINASSTGTIAIQNNTIASLTCSGSTAPIAGTVICINVSAIASSMTISGNTIGNATTDNIRGGTSGLTTGSSFVSGISLTLTPTTTTISGNTIQNLSSYGSNSAGYVRGIFTATVTTVAATATIDNNTIANLSTNSTLGALATGLCGANGIHYASGTRATISNNTIYGISNTNIGAGAGPTNTIVAGISLAASTTTSANTTTVSRNKIYNLSNAGTGGTLTTSPVITGILIRSGPSSSTYSIDNNMVSLGNGITTNTTMIGIWANHGSTPDNALDNIYFNSVNIEGIAASGAWPSFGFLRGDLSLSLRTVPVDIRNNIFNSSRTGGTGKHYAISNHYGTTTASAIGWATNASDYNALNSANSSTIGYWTADKDFASWKTSSLGDIYSVSAVPITFVNPANDLHLNMGTTPTALESGGTAISITTDYDGQARPGGAGITNGGGTAPDLGADEFDGAALDIIAPIISYTALANTSSIANRSLSNVIVTDAGGINITAGTKPRIYYKRSGDNNTYNDNTFGTNGWKYVEASNASSPFSFTVDYSKLNGGTGVTIGQTIQYFVVAQDLAPTANVTINAGVFTVSPASVALTAAAFPITGTINSYTILAGYSGTVNVGSGEVYTSLTGSSGLFAALNAGALTGNLTVNITSGLAEDGTNALNQQLEDGVGGFTITIQPSAAIERGITGAVGLGGMIRLNGADRVSIDGRYSGNGTYLRFRNTNTGNPTITLLNDASYNTIRNCIIEGANATATSGAVVSFSTAAAGGNDFNTITRNTIRDRSDATGIPTNLIFSLGTAANTNSDNTISSNELFNSTANGIGLSATGNGDNWTISGNSIYNTVTPSTAQTGISILAGSSHIISGNYIGGQAASCGGTAWTNTGAITFNGITLTNVGAGGAVSVQDNTIQNINLTNTGAVSFNGFNITGASTVNLGTVTANTIGHNSNINSISNAGSAASITIGVNSTSTATVTISNNTLANLTSLGATINAALRGIYVNGTGQHTITGNTIHTLTSSSIYTGYPSTALSGINTASANTNQVISNNIIYDLVTVAAAAANSASGIIASATGSAGIISQNKVYDVRNNSSAGTIVGLFFSGGVWTVANNQISLDNGGNSTPVTIKGIADTLTTAFANSYFYNAVYIAGNAASGNLNSYAFYRGRTTQIVTALKNNLFYNNRTGGTGNHFAMGNPAATPATGWSATASNNNMLISADLSKVAEWGIGVTQTLAQFQTNSGGDAASTAFANTTYPSASFFVATASCNLKIQLANQIVVMGLGTPVPIVVDYDGAARSSAAPSIGAFEYEQNIWTGASGTNWNDAGNWTNGIPNSSTASVLIPLVSNQPAIGSAAYAVGSIVMNIGTTVSIAPGAGLTIAGTLISNGTISGEGTVTLNGTTVQAVQGNFSIKNLTINNATGATIANGASTMANITGILTPALGTLTTNGRLTLKSTSIANTAMVGIVGGTIVGNVTVERYIPVSNRAFRFLAPGVTGSTIKAAWQEGAVTSSHNPYPGYGTHITGSIVDQTNGFDGTLTGNPSMYTFNNATQAWAAIANTTGIFSDAKTGYRILIRGDRTSGLITNTTTAANIATTLRNTGALATGPQTFTLAASDAQYSLVGNPYWAPVSWTAVSKTNLNSNFYIWNPTLAGSNNRGAYTAAASGDIQPGQAFFVLNAGGASTLGFIEANKNVAGALTNVFRNNSQTEGSIIARLFLKNNLAAGQMADIATTTFNKDFKAIVDKDDAPKFGNPDENISFKVAGTILSINATVLPKSKDTLYMNMANMLSKDYILQMEGRDFAVGTGLEAWVVDSYLNTKTKVDLAGTVNIPYLIDNNASSNAANRFYLLFENKKPLVSLLEDKFDIRLAPNPAKDFVQVSYSAKTKGSTSIRIISNKGQTVYSANLGQQQSGIYKVPVSKLAAGIYTVELTIGDERGTAKLVKQ